MVAAAVLWAVAAKNLLSITKDDLMELQESMAYVERCFRDEPASCECACPFGLDIRGFLKKVSKGRWPAAYRDLGTAIPFPSVAAQLCPRPCEKKCQRIVLGDEPLDLGGLEQACLHFAASERAQEFPLPPKTQRVAVVGAGVAGLACALALARKKFCLTVFETAPDWGGCLRGLPEFKLFAEDFSKQFAAQNVEFRFGVTACEADLVDFDAVYVATGNPTMDFGLRGNWDPVMMTTERPGWFLGGGVVGMPLMESMAAAKKLSQLMEAYLQTGRASLVVEPSAKTCEGHFVEHPDEVSKHRTPPADGLLYTKDEAKTEAARCMMCTCDGCMTNCELMAHYKKTPTKLATDISGDSHTAPPFSNCTATRQTYSCNLCGDCAAHCPENIDLSALFKLSREDRWKRGKWIPGMYDYWLRTLDFHGDEGFYASKNKCKQVFFPGCQLTASSPEQVVSAWNWLRKVENTGIILGCCGAPADWAGDLDRQKSNAEKLRTAWESMDRPQIVTACATCTEQLKDRIPNAEIISLYELLNERDAPVNALPFSQAAVFDPCAARRDDVLHRSVRALAEKAGCKTVDLPGGSNCCGYGGHIRLANPGLYREITDHRAAESEKPYVVYCANCLEVFRTKNKPVAHILSAVFGGDTETIPTLEQKRKNSLRVKGIVMEELEHANFDIEPKPWEKLELEFSEDARTNMEDKLITDSEVAENIFIAQKNTDYFEDSDGLRTACMAKKILTYWVVYREIASGKYRVESAYCHRMRIGEEAPL